MTRSSGEGDLWETDLSLALLLATNVDALVTAVGEGEVRFAGQVKRLTRLFRGRRPQRLVFQADAVCCGGEPIFRPPPGGAPWLGLAHVAGLRSLQALEQVTPAQVAALGRRLAALRPNAAAVDAFRAWLWEGTPGFAVELDDALAGARERLAIDARAGAFLAARAGLPARTRARNAALIRDPAEAAARGRRLTPPGTLGQAQRARLRGLRERSEDSQRWEDAERAAAAAAAELEPVRRPRPRDSRALAPVQRASVAVVTACVELLRGLEAFGSGDPVSRDAASQLRAALEAAEAPFTLQLLGDGLFRDRRPIPVEGSAYLQTIELARTLAGVGVDELVVGIVPRVSELLRWGSALLAARQGDDRVWRGLELPGMAWCGHPELYARADPAELACALVAEAHVAAAEIAAGTRALYEVGTVVRRLERAFSLDGRTCARALETGDLPWTPARRALSSALLTMRALGELKASATITRPAACASLAVGLCGYLGARSLDPESAAQTAFARLGAAGPSPLRARTCALLHALARPGGVSLPVASLVRLSYGLEAGRRAQAPGGAPPGLAELTAQLRVRHSGLWLLALDAALGPHPVGTQVAFADGRLGWSLGREGEETRVQLADGEVFLAGYLQVLVPDRRIPAPERFPATAALPTPEWVEVLAPPPAPLATGPGSPRRAPHRPTRRGPPRQGPPTARRPPRGRPPRPSRRPPRT